MLRYDELAQEYVWCGRGRYRFDNSVMSCLDEPSLPEPLPDLDAFIFLDAFAFAFRPGLRPVDSTA